MPFVLSRLKRSAMQDAMLILRQGVKRTHSDSLKNTGVDHNELGVHSLLLEEDHLTEGAYCFQSVTTH